MTASSSEAASWPSIQFQNSGAAGSQRARAGARVRVGRDLLYLAEKFGFLPPAPPRVLNACRVILADGQCAVPGRWVRPLLRLRTQKIEYAIDRYAMEVKRQLDVLDRHLADNEYLAGGAYSVADMAVWPWYGTLAKGQLYESGEFLQVQDYRHVLRWTDRIAQRPAVGRGRIVNRTWGQPASQLHERHDAGDFESRTQDKSAAQP